MAADKNSDSLGIKGFQDSKRYEQVRPEYPREAVEILMNKLGLTGEDRDSSKRLTILELGAGTGKFTRVMADVLKDWNVHIIASDPVKEMCDQFKEMLPDIELRQFSADEIDAAKESFDAVVAVGCFHWFSFEKSLNEIHRVLVPDGKLGISWNFIAPQFPWLQSVCNYLAPLYEKVSIVWPALHSEKIIDMISSSPKFSKAEKWPDRFIREKKVTPQQVFEIYSSQSVIASSEDDRKKFYKFLDKSIEEHFSLDQEKELTLAYACPLFWFQKLD